jgi:hypothetical protein
MLTLDFAIGIVSWGRHTWVKGAMTSLQHSLVLGISAFLEWLRQWTIVMSHSRKWGIRIWVSIGWRGSEKALGVKAKKIATAIATGFLTLRYSLTKRATKWIFTQFHTRAAIEHCHGHVYHASRASRKS